MMRQLHMIGCAGLMLLHPSLADASLIFNLNPSSLVGQPGSIVHFYGMLDNLGDTNVYLNGDSSILLYATLMVDDQPFFSDTPLFLTANGSYSGPLFDIDIDSAAPLGSSVGSFTIIGGNDSGTYDDLATQAFQVTVSEVPEPCTMLAAMIGCLCLVFTARNTRAP